MSSLCLFEIKIGSSLSYRLIRVCKATEWPSHATAEKSKYPRGYICYRSEEDTPEGAIVTVATSDQGYDGPLSGQGDELEPSSRQDDESTYDQEEVELHHPPRSNLLSRLVGREARV